MKKIFAILCTALLIAIAVFNLAACGGDDAKTLRVINFRPEDEPFYKVLNKAFEDANPGVKVVYESISTDGYPNLLSSRLTGKKVDVFGTEAGNVRSIELRNKMEKLDDLKAPNGGSLWSILEDSEVEQASHAGSKYVAPLGSVTIVVYYNKDIFNSLSPAPSERFENGQYPTTWSEFQALLVSLMAYTNKPSNDLLKIDEVIAFGGMEGWTVSMMDSAAEVSCIRSVENDFYLKMIQCQEGFDFNNQLYTNFFSRLNDVCQYINAKSIQTGQSYALAPSKFATKKCGIMIDGSWSYAQVKMTNPNMNLGFFPLPLNDDAEFNKYVPTKSGSAFAIAKESTKIDLAKKYLEFHYNTDLYNQYINMVMSKPSVKNVELTDATAQQMYAFPTILTMENMWMYGMLGVDLFRDITTKFILGSKTPASAQEDFANMLESTKNQWMKKSNLDMWLERFYPDVTLPDDYNYAPE